MSELRILHLEDSTVDAELIARFLKRSGMSFQMQVALDKNGFEEALANYKPDVILSDHSLPQFNSIEALKLAREQAPDVPFVLVTGTVSEEFAVSCIREGADDYILKSNLTRLPSAIRSALKEKQAFVKLRNSEARYRQIVETAQEGIWMTNKAYETIFANDKMCRILEYSFAEMMGRPVTDFIDEDTPAVIRSQMCQPDRNYLEVQCRTKSGKKIWLEISSSGLLGKNKEFMGLLSMVTDITERKHAADLLRKSEANLSAVIENSTDIIYSLDRNFRYITFNHKVKEAAKDLYNGEVELGDHALFFLEKEDREAAEEWRAIYARVLGGENLAFVKHYKKWDTGRFINFSINPIYENATIIGLACFGRDITHEKLAEEKLIRSEMQIRNFARHLNKTMEEESARIAREIHDELGQQLAGIKMGISSLKKHPEFLSIQEKMASITQEVDHTIQSVRKIATELRPGILDSLGLFPSIEWLATEFEKKSGIRCRKLFSATDTKFDKHTSICFFRVCQESLTNISKHAAATEVEVSLIHTDNYLELRISDNGKGIAGEKLENPFSMGLLGMRERANIAGARLEISSTVGQGTRVRLTIKLEKYD